MIFPPVSIGTLLKDDRKAIRRLASHSPVGQTSTESPSRRGTDRHQKRGTLMLHTERYQFNWNLSSSTKLKSESGKFCTLPMSMGELYPRLLEKGLISPVFLGQSPYHFHDSSKQCEFHFGRLGHSLEDCHALKRKVQDLVDHRILKINEGSIPSVIIAWCPEHHKVEVKDGTIIPSFKSQGPTTCDIQPVHLSILPTLSEVRKPTVPKVQPKLTSKSCNPDDPCSSDREKATTLPTNTWNSSGRSKSLIVWNSKYLLRTNLGSQVCIPSTWKGLNQQLTPMAMSYQRIKLIELLGNLFKGAPELKNSSLPRKKFKTRQDITLLLFPALLLFSFKTILVFYSGL